MKMILSPAKAMRQADDIVMECTTPRFEKESLPLIQQLGSLSFDQLKGVFKASDKVTQPMYGQYQKMAAGKSVPLYPAVYAYHGIAYQYMAPDVLDDGDMDWLQNHLYILSGLYGLLRPLDAIAIYRLEMGAKIPYSLYDYWGSKLADAIDPNDWILNLASAEYAKAIKKYRKVVDVRFYCEDDKGVRKEKGVYAKMARGAMVRFAAQNRIEDVKGLTAFNEFGFVYDEKASTPECLVFIKKPQA